MAKVDAKSAKSTKSVAEEAPKGFDFAEFQGDDYADQQVGFLPYWAPDEEAHEAEIVQGFAGMVVDYEPAVEGKAGAFERFTIRATKAIECKKGKARDAEIVIVPAGEMFSVSRYEAMHLDQFMGCTVAVWAISKDSIPGGKTLWTWKVRATKADDAKLTAKRQRLMDERFSGKAAHAELAGADHGTKAISVHAAS